MANNECPRTPTSEVAWNMLNKIHTAQDGKPHAQEASPSAAASNLSNKRPTPLGDGNLHKGMMKFRMDKMVGGNDPREPMSEGQRTPIGPGQKDNAEDLPRTPSSMDAWKKLNQIAAAQDAHSHHPSHESSMEDLGTDHAPTWDPREPDQPRTPVRTNEAEAKTITTALPTAGNSVRVYFRIEKLHSVKSMHDVVVDFELVDEGGHVIHRDVSEPCPSNGCIHTWDPPLHFSASLPAGLVDAASMRVSLTGKKMLGHRSAGELVVPVNHLPITHAEPGSHEETILTKKGSTGGALLYVCWRQI